jgi:hypothetical protein
MKSFLSLLVALLVMLLLGSAGYWTYQRTTGPTNQNGHVLTAASSDISFTLTNATNFVLTVTMRQGPSLVRFQLAPGKSETRSFPPGTYSVDGRLSDPSTEPFSSKWTFQSAGKYNANFTRDGQAVKVGGVLLLEAAEPSSGNSQTSPANRQPSNLTPPKRP